METKGVYQVQQPAASTSRVCCGGTEGLVAKRRTHGQGHSQTRQADAIPGEGGVGGSGCFRRCGGTKATETPPDPLSDEQERAELNKVDTRSSYHALDSQPSPS